MVSNRAHTIERSTGNVYADLGNPDTEAMLFKTQLTRRIAAIMAKRKLTQQEAACIVGLSQPKFSLILRGQFRGVSEANLLDCLRQLGQDVQMTVKPPRPKADVGTLRVNFA